VDWEPDQVWGPLDSPAGTGPTGSPGCWRPDGSAAAKAETSHWRARVHAERPLVKRLFRGAASAGQQNQS
jgi:hypothetical protein